jgi:uncharacterized protein
MYIVGKTPDTEVAPRRVFMTIDPALLEILVCPQCKGSIRLNRSQDGLMCDHCRLLYEIRDGIPIMLIEEARRIDTMDAE